MFGIGDFFEHSHPTVIRTAVGAGAVGAALVLGLDAAGLFSLTNLFGPAAFLALAGWAMLVGAAAGRMAARGLQDDDTDRDVLAQSGERAPQLSPETPGRPDLSRDEPDHEAGRTFRDRVTASDSAKARARSR